LEDGTHITSMPSSINLRRLATLLAIIIPFFAAKAAAQKPGQDPVTVALTASRIVYTGEKETTQAAVSARPGDLLQYEAAYRNRSRSDIKALQATLPIPAGLELQLGSIKPAGALASIDGITFAAMPLTRTVTGADGKPRQESVPTADYRALRWTAPQLSPGAQFTVSARARVQSNAPLTASK
jgi:hypothetical protein